MTNFALNTHQQPVGLAVKSPQDAVLLLPRIGLYIFNLLLVWQDRATQRQHLASLSDRRLQDMGLKRGDIGVEVSKPFWRG